MGNVVVDVMLKSEILDPQGQAVAFALPRLGFHQFTDVRQGKRFVLTVEGEVTDEVLAAAREAAETMLSGSAGGASPDDLSQPLADEVSQSRTNCLS